MSTATYLLLCIISFVTQSIRIRSNANSSNLVNVSYAIPPSTTQFFHHSTTAPDDTLSLYIYYNDTIDFIDINLESYINQLQLSFIYALQNSIANFTQSNIISIDICSFYQTYGDVYDTDHCVETDEWQFSDEELKTYGAKSLLNMEITVSSTNQLSIKKIILTILELCKSTSFLDQIEQCMNEEDEICDTEYQSTGNFGIIDIEHDRQIIDEQDIDDDNQSNDSSLYRVLIVIAFVLFDYCIYGVMVGFLCIAFVAWIHALKSGYDCVRVSAVILYAIYAWDFYADVIFCVHLIAEGHLMLAVASGFCVAIPFSMQIGALLLYQNEWVKDELVREKVASWLIHWQRKLFLFSFLSGSCYGAVELLNSNIFGREMFSMGLTKKHLSQFRSKRLLTTVLIENVPQLFIQCVYMFHFQGYLFRHFTSLNLDIVLMTAFFSTLVSIITAIIDVCTTRTSYLIGQKQEFVFWMVVELDNHKENGKKAKQCVYKRKALEKGLQKLLEMQMVEIALSYCTTDGIVIAFTVYSDTNKTNSFSNSKNKARITHQLNSAANFGELSSLIQERWKLDQPPIATVLNKSGFIDSNKSLSDMSSNRRARSTTSKFSSTLDELTKEIDIDPLFSSNGTPNLRSLDGKQKNTLPKLTPMSSLKKNQSAEPLENINNMNEIINFLQSPCSTLPTISPLVSTRSYNSYPAKSKDVLHLIDVDTEPYAI